MKFRKKPVVIEAFRWTGGPDQTEDPVWMIDALKRGEATRGSGDLAAGDARFIRDTEGRVYCIAIETLEGTVRAQVGDYIIKGVKGEIYPCKPDIFEATYDPA